MPQSRSGKWAVMSGIILVVSIALSLIFAAAMGGDAVNVAAVIAASPSLLILNVMLNLTLNLAGLISLIAGIYTITKHKEWSVWKPLTALYGLAVLMFLLGEFLFPH